MHRVEIYNWNQIRRLLPGRIGRRVPINRRPVNNFGDLLGPQIVRWAARAHRIDPDGPALRSVRLLSVGSVMQEARTGDVIWGAGVNGMVPDDHHTFENLDVRAVRGPLTKAFLEERGINVPAVFGDPALLLPQAMPHLREWAESKRYDMMIIPNFQDMSRYRGTRLVLDPRSPVDQCLRRIAESRFVVGSSLHGIIVAESLGIPARALRARFDPEFKYRDYYAGTGRPDVEIAGSVEEASRLGGCPLPVWSSDPLFNAFPVDLWRRERP